MSRPFLHAQNRTGSLATRRTVLGASLAAAGSIAVSDRMPAVAATAGTNVWSVQTVAVIGADEICAIGVERVRSRLAANGFKPANVYVNAVRGRTLIGRDANGASVADVVAKARDYFGGDPDVWIIDLWAAASAATVQSLVRQAGRAFGRAPERRVVWLGRARDGSLSTVEQQFNTVAKVELAAVPNAALADLHSFLRSAPTSRIGSGTGARRTGVARRTPASSDYRLEFIARSAGVARVGLDGGWTKSQLLLHPPRATGSIVDPRTGRSWGTVRYEDLYRSGDTLQATLNRCTGGRVVTFPEGVFEMSGFVNGWHDGVRIGSGGAQGCAGIAGSGRGTIFQMRPNSCKETGQLLTADLLGQGAAYFGNFQMRGTDQPLEQWNGLIVVNAPNSVVEHLYGNGATKGYANFPPGETFSVSVYRSDNTVVRDSEFDGRHPVTRQRWGTSPVGWNGSWGRFSRNAVVERVYAHHTVAGMATFWLTDGVRLDNFHSYSCGSGTGRLSASQINFEEVVGQVRVNYPRLFVNGSWYQKSQWAEDPTATANNGFAFGQASTTSSVSDLVCREPRFDLNVNGLFTTAAYKNYTSAAGVKQKITNPPVVIKEGVKLTGHDHTTSGWQSSASVARDFTWVR